jgi:glycosyltransferase involved in cell wall biosynthesis
MRHARFDRLPSLQDGDFEPRYTPARPGSGESGINLFAYFHGRFGLAEAARCYARALLSNRAPVSLSDLRLNLRHDFDDKSLDSVLDGKAPYDVNIVFVNPDYLDQALEQIGERLGRRPLIGCWFWELERVPGEWMAALDSVDAVLVASAFVQEAFERVTDKPIYRVPLPLSSDNDSGLTRSSFGLDASDFVYLTSFDFHSWVERKNPYAVLAAFALAFPRGNEATRLVIKTSNAEHHPDAFAALVRAASRDSRIMVRNQVLEAAHLHSLQRCCDAYVSLHRAEGFGLGIAECMAQGKPVIATAWSGNMEFMTPDNSCLVGYTMIDVAPGAYLHPEQQRWANPSIAEASCWMRRLFDDRELARSIGARARASIRTTLAPERAAQNLLAIVEHVRSTARTSSLIRSVVP